MHRHADLLERAEQVLQPVGQADGAGGRDYLTLAFYAALCAAMIALKKFF